MLWREALIHKRLSIVLENESLSSENIHNLEVVRKALTENKDNLASVYADLEIDENIQKLVDTVYERANTDMGENWMSFMEISDILLQNVDACHVGNLDEYLFSTRAMISSLPYEKKKYFKYFAQSMTGLPYSNQPINLWIEERINLKARITKNKRLNLATTPINVTKHVIMQWRWKEMLLWRWLIQWRRIMSCSLNWY